METDFLTNEILTCAFKVHSALGPGLLESAYQACLKYELLKQGLSVETEKVIPLVYEEITLDCGYRIDLLVNNKAIIELKNVEKFTDVHLAQVLTYLRLANLKTGLLLNFNTKSLRDGIKRVVL
jgi:GxxExxY protein